MNKEIKKLPDSELQIMLIIWNSENAISTGEIVKQLGVKDNRKLQTVQNFLSRLQDKGFVVCEKQGKSNFFVPLIKESEYRKQETRSLLNRFYGNSTKGLIAALVSDQVISQEELDEIRKMLDKGDE